MLIYYEMMVGKTPWTAKNLKELITNVTTKPVVFPDNIEISEESKKFIIDGLKIDEKERCSWKDIFQNKIIKQDLLSKTGKDDEASLKEILNKISHQIY